MERKRYTLSPLSNAKRCCFVFTFQSCLSHNGRNLLHLSFRYAGYHIVGTDDILGDPGNADFTSYLISKRLWSPPTKKTAFDVLPLVLKLPFRDVPYVYELPADLIHQINIEHPAFREVKRLGYKWAAGEDSSMIVRLDPYFHFLLTKPNICISI